MVSIYETLAAMIDQFWRLTEGGEDNLGPAPDFVKRALAITKMFGSAGDGNQYRHIVTQGGLNAANIPQELLQNANNIIMLPTLLHQMVSDE